MKWVKASERLPGIIGIKYFLKDEREIKRIGTLMFTDKKKNLKGFYATEYPDWNNYPINAIEWLDETQSVTNEEIERMVDDYIVNNVGLHYPELVARNLWQYVKTSILPLLITNEGASTATLEELEELVNEKFDKPYVDKPHWDACWDFLKPHLSALLKEKEEQIRNLIEKIYPHDGGHDPCYG